MFGIFLAEFVIGAIAGAVAWDILSRRICRRKPSQPKILTGDNQGDNRQVVPVEVRIGSGEGGLVAAVVNPETGERIAFSGNVATVWQQQVRPGADRCHVLAVLEGVPVVWETAHGIGGQ